MMTTPIVDFINKYKNQKAARFHMPGHKGNNILGFEDMDITEIDGADSLYHANSIILESETNASKIFNAHTFYSTEGSSLSIRAMLYLAMINRKNKNQKPVILASRNVHKTFVTTAALLDFDVEWIYQDDAISYETCVITKEMVLKKLDSMKIKPFALYLTSPDYLGFISNIKEISESLKAYDIPLLVDNAHGAYLKFLNPSIHPIDLGCDICADSAHKTLPALTGASYLHISKNTNPIFKKYAKEALGLFASTSPSYLILESLDMANRYLNDSKDEYIKCFNKVNKLKNKLVNYGYKLIGNEIIKITIDAKDYGYYGYELANYLKDNNIIVEFYDNDFVVLMITPFNSDDDLNLLENILVKLPKKNSIPHNDFKFVKHKKGMSIRNATFSKKELVDINDSIGCVLADTKISCPPAIPIVVCGEIITKEDVNLFKYYGINKVNIVKKVKA